MFEKEGIKYAIEETVGTECLSMPIEDFNFIDLAKSQQEKAQCFKDGAEFGYNKANEWHYVKDGDLPKDNSFVLVWTENGGIATNYGKEYSDGIPENGLFEGIHISDVIAWKEIVLPNIKEN